eukprot:snap_masked-scaffold_15-processed-gene-2.52-mRNA-1 protein AED:1.00 eAED:1.00 QI:0/0/0/0/1/1/2/0/120
MLLKLWKGMEKRFFVAVARCGSISVFHVGTMLQIVTEKGLNIFIRRKSYEYPLLNRLCGRWGTVLLGLLGPLNLKLRFHYLVLLTSQGNRKLSIPCFSLYVKDTVKKRKVERRAEKKSRR